METNKATWLYGAWIGVTSMLAGAAFLMGRASMSSPAEERRPGAPQPTSCGFGHWFSVVIGGEMNFFVDEPFVRFMVNWLGAEILVHQDDPKKFAESYTLIEANFPGYGIAQFEHVSRGHLLPGQEGALYRLVKGPERSRSDFFPTMTRAGLIRAGGAFDSWPRGSDLGL